MKHLRFILWMVFVVLLSTMVHARSGHMKLLAVSEDGDAMHGSVADLYLEIQPGSGRVFMDTFPLTKVDTQISTRFAKEIACDYLDKECSRYDFIYTLRSGSTIIGGPSAGAAITVLTIALLKGYSFDETITMTGTINSGGIIGNVGGVKEKIEAAAASGEISVALIPEGEQMHEIDENQTLDLVEHGKELGIEVIPVSELHEAVYAFTGKITQKKLVNVTIDQNYLNTMNFLSEQLCERSQTLQGNLGIIEKNTTQEQLYETARNLTLFSEQALRMKQSYSAASYCFGANIRYTQVAFLQQNLSHADYKNNYEALRSELFDFEESIRNFPIKTITDLEAYMVVNERITETAQFVKHLHDALNASNHTNESAYLLAYATERLNSAKSWSTFLGKPGREFVFNNDALHHSCRAKIGEVEERVQYVRFFIPAFYTQETTGLTEAYDFLHDENYAQCLFTASKAKSEVDVVLSVIGVSEPKLNSLLDKKLSAVQRVILEQVNQQIFPILGYSYFEYAQSLANSDVSSALLYAEYALELSKMDIYFEQKQGFTFDWSLFDTRAFYLFMAGVAFGVITTMCFMLYVCKRNIKKRKRTRK